MHGALQAIIGLLIHAWLDGQDNMHALRRATGQQQLCSAALSLVSAFLPARLAVAAQKGREIWNVGCCTEF